MRLRVLSWNLFHGRAVPPAGRELFEEFAGALAGWEWDAALLQEVPPWWPAALGERLGADQRLALTSRNALLPARRSIAVRWPDLIKSNGGGANAILIRGDAILEHRLGRLCVWPERRWVHAVRLRDADLWVANVHGGGAIRDAHRAAAAVLRWAADRPALLGGDFNIRALSLDGFSRAGGHGVDLFFLRGLEPVGETEVPERGPLSDHAPVALTIRSAPAPRSPPAPCA